MKCIILIQLDGVKHERMTFPNSKCKGNALQIIKEKGR